MKNILVISFLVCCFAGQVQAKSDTLQVKTSAICGMCKNRIERQLALTKGVKQSKLNLKDKVVTVIYNDEKTSPELIRKSISMAGYDADNVPADPKAYDSLSECCKKDVAPHE